MEYFRSRFEKILNEDNSVKEMFIAVRINKDSDTWEQGYWLTEEERNLVIISEQNLASIVDKVAAIGEIALANYKAEPIVEN